MVKHLCGFDEVFVCLTLLPGQWWTSCHAAGWRGRRSLLLPWWQVSRRGRGRLVAGGRRWRWHHAHWRWQQTYGSINSSIFATQCKVSVFPIGCHEVKKTCKLVPQVYSLMFSLIHLFFYASLIIYSKQYHRVVCSNIATKLLLFY